MGHASVADQAQPQPVENRPGESAGALLLVDDNAALRLFTAHNLRSALPGLLVATCGTCAEARELVERLRPQVVVADQHLPDGRGSTLLQELGRSIAGLSGILISAQAHLSAAQIAGEGMAIETLAKPFEVDDLIEAVERAMRPGVAAAVQGPPKVRTAGPAKAPIADDHLLLNRLSGLMAGLRAFGADLRARADDAEAVRATVDEYLDRLVGSVRELTTLVARGHGRRPR